MLLPGGCPGDGPSRVHQNTPAVACGLVALDRFVKASGAAVGDENGLARILPSLVQCTLSLLRGWIRVFKLFTCAEAHKHDV
ncbi:hypothetical protein EYF80_030556 [Liparis tanakae]|uniref:Uncharacterized protein n=1 Tax=Liparis tanakae TaxID=230148 RepID=A0A4Z2H105_9TELE|nr:hypothetical protein EYF80_030556 [Liparis tanakae]